MLVILHTIMKAGLFLMFSMFILLGAGCVASDKSAMNSDQDSATADTSMGGSQGDPNIVPSVSADDQQLKNNTVTIKEVIAPADGWLLIQQNLEGDVPGPVLGYAAVKAGTNTDITVVLDYGSDEITPELQAMIHEDTGEQGKLDFPEGDMPLMYKDEMVFKIFKVLN